MDELVLENENGRMVILPRAGASMRSLSVKPIGRRWVELLTGAEGSHDPTLLPQGTGSFIMAPWPNRLRYGILHTCKGEYQMPTNRPPHAIHGLVRDREWQVVSASSTTARLSVVLDDPWPFDAVVNYNVSINGPSLLQSLKIEVFEEAQSFPVGFGWHPWFRRHVGTELPWVKVTGQKAVWEIDKEFSATGRQLNTKQVVDLRKGMVPQSGQVDQCMRIAPGSPTSIQWPNAVTLEINSSIEMGHLHVYVTKESVCVEPESCTVNAFRLAQDGIGNTGTVKVGLGRPFSGWTRWSWN